MNTSGPVEDDAKERGNAEPLQSTLPSSWYTSDAIWELEKEWIFSRQWYVAGREEQLQRHGDFLLLDVVGQSIVVVRNQHQELRAFYNVCRHRGAELCPPSGRECGAHHAPLTGGINARGLIRCAYHSWVYDLNGKLVGAPHLMETPGFRKEDFSLYPVGVASWGGFIFVYLVPQEAEPLLQQLGPMAARVRRYPLGDLRVAHTIRYNIAANWKVLAENYNECYHCGGVHPELCEVVPAFRKNGGSGLDWNNGIPHREGAVTYTRSGQTSRAPFAGLDEFELTRHKGELIYPNFFLSLSCDHVASFFLTPLGPAKTEVTCHFLFHPSEIAKADFDPSDAVEFWDLVNRQDWTICERVQRGMSNRVHHSGFYAPMEDMSLDIRTYARSKLEPHL